MPRILKRAGFCFHILDNYMVIFNINVEGHERIKDKDNWDMKRRIRGRARYPPRQTGLDSLKGKKEASLADVLLNSLICRMGFSWGTTSLVMEHV